MTPPKEEFADTESAWPPSDDESTPFRGKCVEEKKSNHWQLTFVISSLGYLVLAAFYVKLWVHSSGLESELGGLKPELFPSIENSNLFRRDSRIFPLEPEDSVFAGVPSPELDHAWHELLEGSTIRVSGEDLAYHNVTSLPLADGSGFASQIFIAHELHCLKKVRQWVYKESYFEDVQGLTRNELERHINHCIETLRQGIMCRGDVSLGTYTYLSGGDNNVTVRNWASHQCVDYDALATWSKARAVDSSENGVLAKPEDLGPEHFTEKKEPH